MATRMVSVDEALPREAQKKLISFVNSVKNGTFIREPGKTKRQLLQERVLEPHRTELEPQWDLTYLSYALCYSLEKNTGVKLLDD